MQFGLDLPTSSVRSRRLTTQEQSQPTLHHLLHGPVPDLPGMLGGILVSHSFGLGRPAASTHLADPSMFATSPTIHTHIFEGHAATGPHQPENS